MPRWQYHCLSKLQQQQQRRRLQNQLQQQEVVLLRAVVTLRLMSMWWMHRVSGPMWYTHMAWVHLACGRALSAP